MKTDIYRYVIERASDGYTLETSESTGMTFDATQNAIDYAKRRIDHYRAEPPFHGSSLPAPFRDDLRIIVERVVTEITTTLEATISMAYQKSDEHTN